MSKKKIQIDLRLPNTTLALLDAIADRGILGETRDEVVMHILRQSMFELDLQERKEKE